MSNSNANRRKDPLKITGFTRVARSVRRWWSSVEWAVTWLGLPRQSNVTTQPGLVLVQIDGLSLSILREALDRNEMPFVKSLAAGLEYRLGPCYSGIPSNWAAAQAELLYGVPSFVPGSLFYDRNEKQVIHITDPTIARRLEKQLAAEHVGLLRGGSSYCNMLGGGATDLHFCGTSSGWSDSFRSLHPLKILSTALLHVGMWVRGAFQIAREIYDLCFAEDPQRELSWWKKLREIPSRVVATVFLRELSTLGACYDAARGLPIIQINFLGYDEQAHRFGPASRRAGRQLRAIDRSLRRIWRAAHLGTGREYDMWIFSTHGQEVTTDSNPQVMARVCDTLSKITAQMPLSGDTTAEPVRIETRHSESLPTPRSTWFGWKGWWMARSSKNQTNTQRPSKPPDVLVVPAGTLAHVYLLSDRLKQQQTMIARELSRSPLAPLILEKIDSLPTEESAPLVRLWLDGQLRIWPENAVHALGATHPNLGHLAEDLVRLVGLPNSGDLILVGWSGVNQTINYLGQAGGHNGPGVEETTGFVLLPSDVFATLPNHSTPRPSDLKLAAHRLLEAQPLVRHNESTPGPPPSGTKSLRVVTYNIHGCVGMDGELSPARIARVLGQCQPDFVCLQEVDRRRARSQGIDQVHAIAEALGMHFVFSPAWEDGEQAFGNAILSALPFKLLKSGMLQRQKATRNGRSALWIETVLATGSSSDATSPKQVPTRLQLITTHLSIYPTEQLSQAEELVREWIEPAKDLGPVVVCGDFNAAPKSSSWATLNRCLRDVEHGRIGQPYPTYFSPYPLLRVDHIFVSEDIQTTSQVITSRLAKIASDHLPVMTDLRFDR
ncbi:MAG: endonuclease/exonuclease/phosphatase family protein [Planctomycetaceae bacterium]|nr:endonuclease/exonuclease/phosphatase family protein [Planctomycetaceae bacterium]